MLSFSYGSGIITLGGRYNTVRICSPAEFLEFLRYLVRHRQDEVISVAEDATHAGGMIHTYSRIVSMCTEEGADSARNVSFVSRAQSSVTLRDTDFDISFPQDKIVEIVMGQIVYVQDRPEPASRFHRANENWAKQEPLVLPMVPEAKRPVYGNPFLVQGKRKARKQAARTAR
jgi:hypothetical protein